MGRLLPKEYNYLLIKDYLGGGSSVGLIVQSSFLHQLLGLLVVERNYNKLLL